MKLKCDEPLSTFAFDLELRPYGKEIIHWDTLAESFKSEMESEADIFGGAEGAKRTADLRLRVIEHNLLVIGRGFHSSTFQLNLSRF